MNWTSIEQAFPATDALVLVTGEHQGSAVVATARLLAALDTSPDSEKLVFADDVYFDPLPFDVSHWQMGPALPRGGIVATYAIA